MTTSHSTTSHSTDDGIDALDPDTAPAGTADAMGTDPVSPSQVRELLAEDPLMRVLDVRTAGEFETAHIPGSYNVPLGTLAEHVAELAALDHPVVLVCKSGARAGQARGKLAAAGKRHLHVLDGGLDAWTSIGGDVVHGTTDRWAMDRQVRLVAGTLGLVGILGSLVVPKAKWLAGGVAAGLTFSAVSNTCAMANVLGRLPYNAGPGCDVDAVVRAMRDGS